MGRLGLPCTSGDAGSCPEDPRRGLPGACPHVCTPIPPGLTSTPRDFPCATSALTSTPPTANPIHSTWSSRGRSPASHLFHLPSSQSHLQYLERPRQKERDLRERQGLRGKMLEDLQQLRQQVYAALEATPERGREFTAAVRHILQWEDAWVAWKQAGCPREPFERPPAVAPAGVDAEGAGLPPAKKRKVVVEAMYGVRVGTDELDRLWNITEDNLSCGWLLLGYAWLPGWRSLCAPGCQHPWPWPCADD